MRPGRGVRFLAGCLLFVALLELSSYAAIAVINRRRERPIQRSAQLLRAERRRMEERVRDWETMYEVDSVLGWRYTLGFQSGAHRLNAQRLRADHDYDTVPRAGVLRVAAFGDSFVYGSEVPLSASWAARIERANPSVEVLNHGVHGYGLDQALLRYRMEGHALHPRVVVMGFVADDLGRLLNVYSPFRSHWLPAFGKPRYVIQGNELRVVASPLRSQADYLHYLDRPADMRAWKDADWWYEPVLYGNVLYDHSATIRLATHGWILLKRRYLDRDRPRRGATINTGSEAYRIQLRIFEEFVKEATSHGEVPLVVLFPERESVARLLRGGGTVYAPMLEDLTRLRIPFADAAGAFRAAGDTLAEAGWFEPGGHYSAKGNEIVARWLGSRIP